MEKFKGLESELVDLLGMINEMKVATEVELVVNTSKKPKELKEMVTTLENEGLIEKDFTISGGTASSFGGAYKTTKRAYKYI